MGFKSWSSTTNPCWLCDCTGATMYRFPASQLDAWNDITRIPFLCSETVQARVVRITVNEPQFRLLKQDMVCAARYGGLACVKDYNFGLQAGDRVVPEGPVTDIHRFHEVQALAQLTFFLGHGHLNFISAMFEVVGFSIETPGWM